LLKSSLEIWIAHEIHAHKIDILFIVQKIEKTNDNQKNLQNKFSTLVLGFLVCKNYFEVIQDLQKEVQILHFVLIYGHTYLWYKEFTWMHFCKYFSKKFIRFSKRIFKYLVGILALYRSATRSTNKQSRLLCRSTEQSTRYALTCTSVSCARQSIDWLTTVFLMLCLLTSTD